MPSLLLRTPSSCPAANIRFGLTFLDRYYIEFDIKNKKVGLAKSIVNQSGTVNQGPVTPAVTSQAAKSEDFPIADA